MIIFAKLVLICLFAPYFPSSNGEMLNRFDRILEWAVMEEQMYSMAKAYVKRLEDELSQLNSFISDYEETTLGHLEGITKVKEEDDINVKTEDDSEGGVDSLDVRANEVASNPILIYHLSHRLVTIVPELQKHLLKVDTEGQALNEMIAAFANPKIFLEEIKEVEQRFPGLGSDHKHFPVEADLEDAIESLVILYDTYESANVTPENFAAILSPGTNRHVNISSFHAVQISLKSFFLGLYGNAIDWISYAVKRSANQEIRDYSISKDIIHYTKGFMVKTHNTELSNPPRYFVSPTTSLNFYTDQVTDEIMAENASDDQRIKRRNSTYLQAAIQKGNVSLSPDEELTLSFYDLCGRGLSKSRTTLQTGKRQRLRCYLGKRLHPFFMLRPLKIEELSKTPKILHYYDVLGPEELYQLRLLVANFPMDKEINGHGDDRHSPDLEGTRTVPERTGVEVEVVPGKKKKLLKRLQRKMELLAGVPPKKFQLTEYVAGRYEALVNFGSPSEEPRQKFKSALQFHLNSVDKGGESLLGQYGPVVPPVEGSAIYWEASLKEDEDGNVQYNLWSGSCPVIQGHKLIITKYFTP